MIETFMERISTKLKVKMESYINIFKYILFLFDYTYICCVNYIIYCKRALLKISKMRRK